MQDVTAITKVLGTRRSDTPGSAQENRARAWALQQHADRINPYPKPRGFVFKARTREDYEAWRKSQSNPRLW